MMPKLFGITGVWIALPISNIALSLVVLVLLWRDVRHLSHSGGMKEAIA